MAFYFVFTIIMLTESRIKFVCLHAPTAKNETYQTQDLG